MSEILIAFSLICQVKSSSPLAAQERQRKCVAELLSCVYSYEGSLDKTKVAHQCLMNKFVEKPESKK
jgi:hypothetical protein